MSVAAVAATGDDGGNYRTAYAGTGTVTQTITAGGTVDAAQRSDVASAVPGSVARVPVAPGDSVQGGDLLVALDRADAERALRRARAAVAQARADLERAENPQDEAVQAAGQTELAAPAAAEPVAAEPATTQVTTVSWSGTEPASSSQQSGEERITPLPTIDLPALSELQARQDAVKTAQTASSSALADASAALDAQVSACANAYGRDQTGAGVDNSTGTEEGQPTDPPGTPVDQEVNDACDAALAAVEVAQQTVSQRQTELQATLDDLTAALVAATEKTSAAVTALQAWVTQQQAASEDEDVPEPPDGQQGASGGQPSVGQAPGGQASGGQAPSGQAPGTQSPGPQVPGTGGTGGTGSGAVRPEASGPEALAAASALGVASAQAAVDKADADLVAAQQDLDATRIEARGPGTVAAVNTAAGESVAAGDVVVTVVGDEGATVTMTLSGADVDAVAVGQAADVTLPGATRSATGEVTWVSTVSSPGAGPLPFTSPSTYAAVVHVSAGELGATVLPQGAPADVSITVGSSQDAVTVPTSAVDPEASGASVRVLEDDGPVVRAVEVGRTGGGRTELLSGIEPGEQVVLADLDADIDAASEVPAGATGFRGGGGLPAGGGQGGFRGP